MRAKSLLYSIALIYVGFCFFIACKQPISNSPTQVPTLVNISITTLPVKTNYVVGEALNITGLVVTATYSDNTTAPVTVTAANVTGFSSSTAGNKTLTVTYSGKVATFTVTVNTSFVAVTNITDVPEVAVVGVSLTLTAMVAPSNATNKAIVWNVKNAGATGATIAYGSSVLNTTSQGTVTVTATIADGTSTSVAYVKDFTLTVISLDNFVPVTNITNVPSRAYVGTPLALSGTVSPSNATNKTIIWSVKSGTGVSISGNILNTTIAGTVTVTAAILNGVNSTQAYTKDFSITVYGAFIPVTSISNVNDYGKAGVAKTLSGTVEPSNATNKTIVWSVKNAGTTGAKISSSTITFTGEGTAVVTATIASGLTPYNGIVQGASYSQDFTINVDPAFVAVTGITDVPTTAYVGTALPLGGTVFPSNANNKTISWSVQSGTGVSISSNRLNTTSASIGVVVVTATITNGSAAGVSYTQDFPINVLGTRPVINLTIDDFTFIDEGSGVFASVPPIILSKASKSSQAITLNDLSDVVWYLGNIKLETGNSITLNAANFNIGTYTLSVAFTKDNKSWLGRLSFTVTE